MKKINKTKIVVLVLVVLAIIVTVVGIIYQSSNRTHDIQLEDIQAKYYILQQGNKYGVIDIRWK